MDSWFGLQKWGCNSVNKYFVTLPTEENYIATANMASFVYSDILQMIFLQVGVVVSLLSLWELHHNILFDRWQQYASIEVNLFIRWVLSVPLTDRLYLGWLSENIWSPIAFMLSFFKIRT